jgi:hypothetical protein
MRMFRSVSFTKPVAPQRRAGARNRLGRGHAAQAKRGSGVEGTCGHSAALTPGTSEPTTDGLSHNITRQRRDCSHQSSSPS